MEMKTDYQRLGGEVGLEKIVREFIELVYEDKIIGFFFEGIDKDALMKREFEFASRHLGGPHSYQGKAIANVHQKHPINRGHFHRRLWLLSSVLRGNDVPIDIVENWLEHNRQFENVVTDGRACLD